MLVNHADGGWEPPSLSVEVRDRGRDSVRGSDDEKRGWSMVHWGDEDEDEWGESTGELSKNGPGVMRPLYCQP